MLSALRSLPFILLGIVKLFLDTLYFCVMFGVVFILGFLGFSYDLIKYGLFHKHD